MVGGLATSFLMELLVYPVLYEWWMSRAISANAFQSEGPSCITATDSN
jgi:hypothetical protein